MPRQSTIVPPDAPETEINELIALVPPSCITGHDYTEFIAVKRSYRKEGKDTKVYSTLYCRKCGGTLKVHVDTWKNFTVKLQKERLKEHL